MFNSGNGDGIGNGEKKPAGPPSPITHNNLFSHVARSMRPRMRWTWRA